MSYLVVDGNGRVVDTNHPINLLSLLAVGPAGAPGTFLKTNADATALEWGAGSAGSGDVATDVLWDTKGDLAVATGADSASKLARGTDGQVLSTLASEATGLKWIDPPAGGSGSVLEVQVFS